MGGGGDFGSGSGSKFNCAARVGSGQTISGTGRVRASVLSPCRPLVCGIQTWVNFTFIIISVISQQGALSQQKQRGFLGND